MQTFPREMRPIIKFVAVFAAIFFAASVSKAQVRIQKARLEPQTQPPFADGLSKNPELLKEFGNLINQFQHNIQYPGPRSESRLLPLLPASTMIYAAFPNYGQASDQAVKILRQELQDNAAFRDRWHQGEMATTGPKLEDALQKFSELNDFLGEEIVVSGTSDGKKPSFVMVAEVRKPGLKKYLQQMFPDPGGQRKAANPRVRSARSLPPLSTKALRRRAVSSPGPPGFCLFGLRKIWPRFAKLQRAPRSAGPRVCGDSLRQASRAGVSGTARPSLRRGGLAWFYQ